MFGALPFMTVGPKLRTWLAMMAASGAAMLVPAMTIGAAVDSPVVGCYIIIDALAGWIVIRHPAGWVQKFIGAVFALMVSFHVGFLIADRPAATLAYLHWLSWAGWLQWAALVVWGLYDTGKAVADRAWPNRHPSPARAGV